MAIVAGLFGLVPLMVQIVSTRARRRDRMTRLNQLRAELELLERLHTLQGEVSATDEVTKPPTNVVIRDSLSKVLDQYNNLSEIAPSTLVGGKPRSTQQLSFLRRALLLYNPHTSSGWLLHTLFYMVTFVYLSLSLTALVAIGRNAWWAELNLAFWFYVLLLIIQRLARRNAARNAAQLEEPNA